MNHLENLLTQIRTCTICADLPLGPKPILKVSDTAKILIAGQAPGSKTHDKGIPFDDPSGDRLRKWLGIDREQFYDDPRLAIVPMGFCFPGTGKSGDLPPRDECAQNWRDKVLHHMPQIELTLVIGRYAIDWHLPALKKVSITNAARDWRTYWPQHLIMPHPSPRNNRWLVQNPWFEQEIIPMLQSRVGAILS